jgi:amino acid transporter
VAMRRAAGTLVRRDDLGEGIGYALKRRFLGRPLINEQLSEQRLSKVIALGVLAPDGISSSAYGTEEILIELLKGGLVATAFTVILPMTGVVLFVMALVVLSYREVVTVYTRAGGSYVVARENFGPRVAQIAAVALLIDYVVTVAVQVAAGTAAVASAIPALSNPTLLTVISIAIVLVMCYGNLRGIREAGRAFAVPTYLFSSVMILVIIVGLVREVLGNLGVYAYPRVVNGATQYGSHGAHNLNSLISFGLIFVLLRSFANGGSSLTGIEAVSNAVSAFKPPEGVNARKVLVAEGLILGTLVAGISWLAHVTHAAPFKSGVPTVIAQEAHIVFGFSLFGKIVYYVVQAATALILYTGGNTSFNGFPFLASFVAEDAFLPRWLTKRGHRLVFSNGIIVLAVLSCTLLAVVGANVNALVPFYAIGVFTAFTMAGFGMAKYHTTHKEPGWRHKRVINFSAGVTSMVVVLIFVVVKFTEGAWLVVLLFLGGVPGLIWLNRQYGLEAAVLENISTRRKKQGPPDPVTYARRTVFVFVDDFDLATISALRYARSLRPTTLQAVHFVVDNVQADRLRQDWLRGNTGIALEFVDCPDRRIAAAAGAMVNAEASLPGVGVTAILPRRSYAPVVGRLLHDRTADKMAGVISRIPYAVATIVPFDVRSRVESLAVRQADGADGRAVTGAKADAGRAAAAKAAKARAVKQQQLAEQQQAARPGQPETAGDGGSASAPDRPGKKSKPASDGRPDEQPPAGQTGQPDEAGQGAQPGQGGQTGQPGQTGQGGPAGQGRTGQSAQPGRGVTTGQGAAGATAGQAASTSQGPATGDEADGAAPAQSDADGQTEAAGQDSDSGEGATGRGATGQDRTGQDAARRDRSARRGLGRRGAGRTAESGADQDGPAIPGQAEQQADQPIGEAADAAVAATSEHALRAADGSDYDHPAPPPGVSPIGSLIKPTRAVVQGRVHAVEIRPLEHSTVLACDIADSTGELTALFYGRSNIPGLRPGSKVRLRGQVGIRDGRPVMVNPAYELLAQSDQPDKPRPRRGPRRGPDEGGA